MSPVEAEVLQILYMNAERVDLLVTMVPGEWQLGPSDIAQALGGLEQRGLVASTGDPDGVWWELTPEGRSLASG